MPRSSYYSDQLAARGRAHRSVALVHSQQLRDLIKRKRHIIIIIIIIVA